MRARTFCGALQLTQVADAGAVVDTLRAAAQLGSTAQKPLEHRCHFRPLGSEAGLLLQAKSAAMCRAGGSAAGDSRIHSRRRLTCSQVCGVEAELLLARRAARLLRLAGLSAVQELTAVCQEGLSHT